MFEEIQITDIEKYITKDTKLVIDADGIAFKPACILDESYISVTHKVYNTTLEFKNITEFKGNVRGEGKIGANSYLGSENQKLILKGLEPFKLEDFEIIKKRRPSNVKIENQFKAIDNHIEAIQEATKCEKTVILLGSGECHRHKLLLPEQYKSNRKGEDKPLRLQEVRDYLKNKTSTYVVKGIEADDQLTMAMFKGYNDYLVNNKFSYIGSSNDKDALGTAGLLFNWDRADLRFKHKNPFLINNYTRSVGGVDLVKGELKAYGLMQVARQMLMGDQSDGYHPFKSVNTNFSIGDKKLYEKLFDIQTQKNVLQVVVDYYKEAFPDGKIVYKAWDGTPMSLSILEWMNMQFACVYMLRGVGDTTTFEKLLKHFKVDY